MRVLDIAIECDRLGFSPCLLFDRHPHLSLEQVHDALFFYYKDCDDLDQEIESLKIRIEEIGKIYP